MEFFKEDPFRVVPAGKIDYWAGRPETKTVVDNLISEFKGATQSRILSLWGIWGSGKSHTIRYIENKMEDTCIIVRSPISKNAKNFSALYKETFANRFDWKLFAECCLNIYEANCEGDNWQEKFATIVDSILKKDLDFARIVYLIGHALRYSSFEESNLTNKEFVLCFQWLNGAKLGATELRKINVSKPLVDDLSFVRVMGNIVRIITSDYGKKKVIWALDDCQSLKDIPKCGDSLQQGLRDVYDEWENGLCIILSSASKDPEAFETMLIGDLVSRISPTWKIELRNFDSKDLSGSVQFIKDLINVPRFKVEGKDEFYPFENEPVIESILQKMEKTSTDFTPRKIMEVFSSITSQAKSQNLTKIDQEFVDKFEIPNSS